jgi:hypothetical protein
MMVMIMVVRQLEERLDCARLTLKRATRENIIELCQKYLALLAEYRIQLYELQKMPGIHQQPWSGSPPEDIGNTRKTTRAAIERTTQERNRIEMLLLSFTTVSGYQAVELFNRRKYVGHDDWVLRASGLRSAGSSGDDVMTIQEAVDIASLLRRDEYIAQNAAQAFKEDRTSSVG